MARIPTFATIPLGITGGVSIDQNIALTGGKISLKSGLDLNRQLGHGAFNEFMSSPIGITITQPIMGINIQKWNRKIQPVRYQEAKAHYIERVEGVTLSAISGFFNLLLAQENLKIAQQNLENAIKLHEIALAKGKSDKYLKVNSCSLIYQLYKQKAK